MVSAVNAFHMPREPTQNLRAYMTRRGVGSDFQAQRSSNSGTVMQTQLKNMGNSTNELQTPKNKVLLDKLIVVSHEPHPPSEDTKVH